MVNFEAIIFYLFLLDSAMGNLAVWIFPGFNKWYKKNWPKLHKHLPTTKPWMLIYLVLVIWVGYALSRLGII